MVSNRTTTKRPAGATGIPVTPARRKTRSPRNWRATSHGARGSIAVPRPGSSPASAKQAQLLGCDPHHADLLIARASGFLCADQRSAPLRSAEIAALVVYRATADVVIGLKAHRSATRAHARRATGIRRAGPAAGLRAGRRSAASTGAAWPPSVGNSSRRETYSQKWSHRGHRHTSPKGAHPGPAPTHATTRTVTITTPMTYAKILGRVRIPKMPRGHRRRRQALSPHHAGIARGVHGTEVLGVCVGGRLSLRNTALRPPPRAAHHRRRVGRSITETVPPALARTRVCPAD